MSDQKTKVMMILQDYPQISQTYIKAEIEAVKDAYDLRIVSLSEAPDRYRNHLPFDKVESIPDVVRKIQEQRPDVLHSHWLTMAGTLSRVAWETGTPFTIRAHSFDTCPPSQVGAVPDFMQGLVRAINDEMCVGMLSFPYTRPFLEKLGVNPRKLTDCWPVLAYDNIHDPGPNGRGVMNVGTRDKKKRMQDFVDLALLVPDRTYDLYLVDSCHEDDVVEYNQKKGSPVRIHPSRDPEQMKAAYKAHDWLVYTANRRMNSVGWPVAIAEAQAAGLGVCVPSIRPDIRDYIGPAGFVYDTIEQAAQIIRQPYPEEMRQAGFEHARRSDIQRHKHLLTQLWDQAASRPRRSRSLAGKVIGKLKTLIGAK